MGYTINEDGTVTRDRVPNTSNISGESNYSGNSTNNSGGDDNNGCWIIAVIVGIIIAVSSANKNSSSSNDGYYDTDSCVVDFVAYDYYEDGDTVVAEEYYSSSTSSNLDVSDSSISLSWEEQSYTINVYSTSSWWVDVITDDWISLDCEGTQITMYVDSNPAEGSRHDYFVIKNDEGLTKRVDIYQE